MTDPKYQDESRILLDFDEAVIFLSLDDNGEFWKKVEPSLNTPHFIIDERPKYRLSVLRRLVC